MHARLKDGQSAKVCKDIIAQLTTLRSDKQKELCVVKKSLSLMGISESTRQFEISYACFCLKLLKKT